MPRVNTWGSWEVMDGTRSLSTNPPVNHWTRAATVCEAIALKHNLQL
ncbi:hypothetical protein [Coleofasciculus sp. FACHB-129]|nr:hypothetical protein [Coleofasciculus sp. FACHB-129]MBD1898327.1 hypothetical protein [Coleofasciculus sp. FACHB-129]